MYFSVVENHDTNSRIVSLETDVLKFGHTGKLIVKGCSSNCNENIKLLIHCIVVSISLL